MNLHSVDELDNHEANGYGHDWDLDSTSHYFCVSNLTRSGAKGRGFA